jgi:hypothetical protein
LLWTIPTTIVLSFFTYRYYKSNSPRSFIKFDENPYSREIYVRPRGYDKWIPIKTWLTEEIP